MRYLARQVLVYFFPTYLPTSSSISSSQHIPHRIACANPLSAIFSDSLSEMHTIILNKIPCKSCSPSYTPLEGEGENYLTYICTCTHMHTPPTRLLPLQSTPTHTRKPSSLLLSILSSLSDFPILVRLTGGAQGMPTSS